MDEPLCHLLSDLLFGQSNRVFEALRELVNQGQGSQEKSRRITVLLSNYQNNYGKHL
jgi:hypothetical protein